LTGQRGHVLEIIVVPSSTAEEESIAEFMSNERLPPFLQIDIEAGGKVYGREGEGEGGAKRRLERKATSDSKTFIPPPYITENLKLVALLLPARSSQSSTCWEAKNLH